MMRSSLELKSRHLKVSYRQPQSRRSEYIKPNLEPMPYVRLPGRWLGEVGFAIGSDVRVQVSVGKLVLGVYRGGAD